MARETDILDAIERCKRVLREHPDRKVFRLRVSRPHLYLFLEYLQSMDPDMPPPPICKALGPLVGDQMMNRKLHHLTELRDTLGPLVIRLGMIADQMERQRDRNHP